MRMLTSTALIAAITILLSASLNFAADKKTTPSKKWTTTTNTASDKKSPAPASSTNQPGSQINTGSTNVAPNELNQEALDLLNRLNAPAKPQAGERIDWDVIASGGGSMSSTNYVLDGTLGQTVAGESSSPNYALNAGFWQNFAVADYMCGDIDDNARVDVSDVVYLLNYIFAGGPAPDPFESADVNCSTQLDITDAVYLISFIFAGGPAPCALCP